MLIISFIILRQSGMLCLTSGSACTCSLLGTKLSTLCSLMPFSLSLLNCFCLLFLAIFSNLKLYCLIRVISSLFCFPAFSQLGIYLPRHVFLPLFLVPHSPGFAIQFFLLSFPHWNEMISCHMLLAGGLLGRVERQVLGHSFSHYSKILALPATAAFG